MGISMKCECLHGTLTLSRWITDSAKESTPDLPHPSLDASIEEVYFALPQPANEVHLRNRTDICQYRADAPFSPMY
jgi:hypothetical protein